MSKKTLLNETTVRRFMKLANTQPLADNFVNEYGMAAKAHEDEEEAPDDMGPERWTWVAWMTRQWMSLWLTHPWMSPLDDEPEADMDMGGDADEVEISEDDRDVSSSSSRNSPEDRWRRLVMRTWTWTWLMTLVRCAPMMEEEAVEEGMHAMKDEEDTMEEAKHDEDEPMEEAASLDEDELVQEVTRRVAEKLRAAMKK
jgi:hypothetical protein